MYVVFMEKRTDCLSLHMFFNKENVLQLLQSHSRESTLHLVVSTVLWPSWDRGPSRRSAPAAPCSHDMGSCHWPLPAGWNRASAPGQRERAQYSQWREVCLWKVS